MVETGHDIPLTKQDPVTYSIIEQTLISRSGQDEDCEDAIYIGPHFVAVIDGATSKTGNKWDDKTSGKIAAEIIHNAFDLIPPDATSREAVDILTAAIQAFYKQHDVIDVVRDQPMMRAIGCFVAVSFQRKEVWMVCDCQCMLNQEIFLNNKNIDAVMSNSRAMFLEAEIAQGKTLESLLQHDTGREFIFPLLERQMIFQNNPQTGEYWFSVIDGFDVSDEGIHVIPLASDIETIVLASDGYPYLKDTLDASEKALQEVLQEDPLLFRKYKSTKGLQPGNVSFDDRAYVKIALKGSDTEE